jgi:tryptophan-rich sensory protein
MFAGRMFTVRGVSEWYLTVIKPSFTPPGSFIGIMWTLIYILTAISLILFINQGRNSEKFWLIIGVFVLNGIINALWSYLFFTKHLIGLAAIDAGFIAVTVGLMMVLVWPYSKFSSLLLLPYLIWVSFATYLNFTIYRMN